MHYGIYPIQRQNKMGFFVSQQFQFEWRYIEHNTVQIYIYI